MTVTVITPTGDRQLAFSLLQKWMKAQTKQPDQWVVVDDGKVPTVPSMSMQLVRRFPQQTDPKFTLALNLKTAFPLVKGDVVLIMEDDEYYAPEYIDTMVRALDSHVITGIAKAKYYHLPTGGYYQNANDRHASLAETAFRTSILPEISRIVNEKDDPFIDIRIWKKFLPLGKLFEDTNLPLYCGMKGLPGRAGIGGGHNPAMYRNRKDGADRAMLKAWVPGDYRVYMEALYLTLAGKTETNYCRRMLCDIIVPTYEKEELTIACFESIKRCTTPGEYRIIWVDNASKDTRRIEQVLTGVNYISIRLQSNIGFVGAVNRGIVISNSDYVCLLNNDTIVSTRWLDKMIDALRKNHKLGIVGALTAPLPVLARELWPKEITDIRQLKKDYDSHHNIRYIEDMQMHRAYFPEYVNLEDFNRRIEEKFSGVLAGVSFVAFLCAVIKREVVDKVGLLDVNYAMGMYDDNDYDIAVKRAGWETKLLHDTCIEHFGHATFRHIHATEKFDDNALRLKNLAYMKKKWGLK